jgi:hypothetical protein
MTVEVDGEWGPYLECNPLNATDPLGGWNCTDGIGGNAYPKDYPKQCIAGNFTFEERGYCLSQDTYKPEFTFKNVDLGDCCEQADKHGGQGPTSDYGVATY